MIEHTSRKSLVDIDVAQSVWDHLTSPCFIMGAEGSTPKEKTYSKKLLDFFKKHLEPMDFPEAYFATEIIFSQDFIDMVKDS